MIEVADYRADGMKLIVRLKCTCGGRRILKIMEGNEAVYQCANCKSKQALRVLKNEATTYWRGRAWEVQCEEPKKGLEPIQTHYSAQLMAQEDRFSAPYCTLTGHCIELGPSSLLFVAQNFNKAHFQGMSTKYRFAFIAFDKSVRALPPLIHGAIVEIKFREGELPVCHIRVALDLSQAEEKQIAAHVDSLRGRLTAWSLE